MVSVFGFRGKANNLGSRVKGEEFWVQEVPELVDHLARELDVDPVQLCRQEPGPGFSVWSSLNKATGSSQRFEWNVSRLINYQAQALKLIE